MKVHTLETLRSQAADAIAREDVATLKRLVQDGAVFAQFTIQNPTDAAETAFVAWRAAGRPGDVGEVSEVRSLNWWVSKVKYCRTVMALDTDDVWEIANAKPRQAEEIFASKVQGFGAAKSCFALACAGIGRQACLDVHMLRRNDALMRTVPGFGRTKKGGFEYLQTDRSKKRFSRYFELVDMIMTCGTMAGHDVADSARAQWSDWLTFMDRTDAHDMLIAA